MISTHALPRATQHPYDPGARLVPGGADFILFAPHASSVTLCLFDEGRGETRWALAREPSGTWTGHVAGVSAGQLYGYRVDGPWNPATGMLHNPAKVVLDPYAKAIVPATMHPALFSPGFDPQGGINEPDSEDSAPWAPLGVVVEEPTPRTRHLFTPWAKTVIYEAHVKGFTALHPGVPQELRGTYAGMAHPAVIDYLTSLGVTTLELLPIHAKLDEPFLTAKSLTNYWGYNTLGFFCPEPSYATEAARAAGPSGVIEEVQAMVAALHEAGIEVVLDVVYNHTCEGGADGPTVSWRGIDNTAYYVLSQDRPSKAVDYTGCGNSLDFRRSAVVNMTLDSLRYWAGTIGVDGFRFDLAVTLGRNGDRFDPRHPLLVAMTADPILRSSKLINEPWDLGPNGWRTGQFPAPMADWNDHFRNSTRDFWITAPRSLTNGGSATDLRDLATRLAGSTDLFWHGRVPGGRGPAASVNLVTAHDGFTLRDLVSYDAKHNEANKESNRDGSDHNQSWNFGAEGTDAGNEAIERERRRAQRNLLGTLILATGTPMITAGDEFGRSQGGNNNAYCQDNDISWVNWDLEGWQSDLLATVRHLLRLRREIATLHPTSFYSERAAEGDELLDLQWFDVDGEPMPQRAWFDPHHRALHMLRSGRGEAPDALIVLNGSADPETVRLPEGRRATWELTWDSTWERPLPSWPSAPGALTTLDPFSMRLYLSRLPETPERG